MLFLAAPLLVGPASAQSSLSPQRTEQAWGVGFALRAARECGRMSQAEEDALRLHAAMQAVQFGARLGSESNGGNLMTALNRGLDDATVAHVRRGAALCATVSERDVSRFRSMAAHTMAVFPN